MTRDAQSHWMSLEELELRGAGTEAAPGPERTDDGAGWSRRSFLKAAGFGGAGILMMGCNPAPVRKAIPFLVPVEEIVPGRAYYYASTCAGCSASCGLMVKNRDGRPIKLEGFRGAAGAGDRSHPISAGGLCAVGQASLLGLYDSERFKGPAIDGKPATWAAVDALVGERLRTGGGRLAVLTSTDTSLTTAARLEGLLARHPGARHVVHDAESCSAMLDAHERAFGRRVLPRLHFDRADVVVGVGCDFLGTWVSPVEYAADYASRRDPGAADRMSLHVQLDSCMTITSAKADRRIVATEREQILMLRDLVAGLARRAGRTLPDGWGPAVKPDPRLVDLTERLWSARGKSLVVTGIQDTDAQNATVLVNEMLGNYGETLDVDHPSWQRQGRDAELLRLVEEMERGDVAVLVLRGVNPLYDSPLADRFAKALDGVGTVVCTASAPDETTARAHVVCPEPHSLEAWDDAVPVDGVLCMTQPAIEPLFETRSFRESLAVWSGETQDDLEFRRGHIEEAVDWRATGATSFTEFWNQAVHDGVAAIPSLESVKTRFDASNLTSSERPASGEDGLELALFFQAGVLDGRHAHNAWLQEMPDPITKISWGNAALIGVGTARELGVEDGDVLAVTSGEATLELPARIQPGQHDGVVAIPLGYGRAGTDRFTSVGPDWLEARATVERGGVVGVNAAALMRMEDGLVKRSAPVAIRKTGRRVELALAQTWGSIDVPASTAPGGVRRRPHIIEETTSAALALAHADGHGGSHHGDVDLWSDDHANDHPQWGMSIDLNRCTGCSACVVACQVENNVPVVGRDEVLRRRDMYWLRLDRYYSGDPDRPEDVDVVQQPMMCHHCDNAPCETVCPVLATVHSEEGLNQQVYNRCVGTRYCANNCPYKVRRFNWFEYAHEDRLQNMVLNPDIAVRSRGVMEKCSFCVQRIQEAKAEARRNGAPIADGDIQPACMQTCGTNAISFGDRTDPDSAVARDMADPLNYRVLAELNVKPSVGYRTLVRNRREDAK